MNRRELLRLCAAGPLLPAACTRKPTGRRAIRVATAPYLSLANVYLSDELGYFGDAGLRLEMQTVNNPTQAVPLLVGGNSDVILFSVNPAMINAIAKGARLRIVAGREVLSPTCGDRSALYGNRKSFPDGLRDPRQLRGKRVAITGRADFSEFILDTFLEFAGMTQDDVEIVPVGRSEAMAVLVAGKVDAMISHGVDKDLTEASDAIVRGVAPSHYVPNFQISFLIYGPTLLDGDAAPGAAFLKAYLRGVREFGAGKTPRFLEEFAKTNGMDPAGARNACRNIFQEDGAIHMADLQRYIDWAVRKGYCPTAITPASMVDTRFLEKVRNV